MTGDRRVELLAKYDRWAAHREQLSAAEESGEYPSPGQWEGSDDTAVELLDEFVTFIKGSG